MAFGDLKGTFGVALTSAVTSNVATGSATAVSVGDLVYAVFAEQTALTVSAVADSLGNTYTAVNVGTDAGSVSGRPFYSRITTAGSLTSLTGTATASTNNIAFIAAVFEGPFTEPSIDASPSNITAGSAGTSYTCPATGDRVQAIELVVGWMARGAGTAFAATAPNLLATQLATATVGQAVIGYQTTVNSSSLSPVFTSSATAGVRVLGSNSFKFQPDTRTVRGINRYEWRRRDYSAALKSLDYRNVAVLEPAVAAGLPPGEQLTKIPQRSEVRRPQDWIQPSPTVLISPAVAAVPSIAENWPVPRSQSRYIADWTSYILPWAQAPPQANYDWPNPRGNRPPLRDWSDSFKLPLQEVLPDNQYDWPNPRGPRPIPRDWGDWITIQVAQPPRQTDWPNPRIARRNPQDWILPTPTTLTVAPEAVPPINQTDWPNPRGPRHGVQDWSDSFKLPLQQVLPPNQEDWPVPKAPRRGVQGWIAPTNIALTQVTGAPFVQTNWPVPRGPRSNILLGWIDKLIVDILPPQGNYDQPNPRTAKRNPQDWIRSTPNTLTAAPAATPPNNQTEWPVPRGSRRNPRDWIASIPNTVTVPPATPPINQTEWPVPRGQRRNPQDWQDSFNLPLQQTLPPTQKNWPLPTPARRRGPQDWIRPVNLVLYTTVQLKPPNRQWDWPVPKGRRQPVITTRYFVRGLIPPVSPIYNPDLALKNEVQRVRYLDNPTSRVRYLKNEIRS